MFNTHWTKTQLEEIQVRNGCNYLSHDSDATQEQMLHAERVRRCK